MAGLVSGDRDTRRLGERLALKSEEIAAAWLVRLEALLAIDRQEVFPSHQLLDGVPELIQQIAAHVAHPAAHDFTASPGTLQHAAELGRRRYRQHTTVRQLFREYQILGQLLEEALAREIESDTSDDPETLNVAMRRVTDALRVLEQQTVDAFVEQYRETIQRQTEQLRKFSRLVSHEIRQPLAVMQVIARALPVHTGDVDAARMMDILHRNVSRLAEVTGKLERLARITRATDLSPNEQPVDLAALVNNVKRQLADMAAARGVDVIVRPNLPSVRLDPARAELVLTNLIANAIKFSDPAKAERFVEVYGTDGDAPGVIIRDNGVGIPAPRLQQIFREFVRAHAQRHDEHSAPALGLGLSIVRECMDAANGAVRVESIEGKGTTFKLTWPPR
jgi:signal transduction histidine kinase